MAETKIRNMCVNCEHRGKTFTSAYSGKTMIVCKLTEKSQFDYQGCEDWEQYKKPAPLNTSENPEPF